MNNPKEKLKDFFEKNGIVELSKVTGLSYIDIIDKLDLNFKTFKDIIFNSIHDGVFGRIMFENGYGASVVSHSFSYGGKKGLYELAVLDKFGESTYDTTITDNVIGHLTPEEVSEKLIEIQDLKN